MVIVATGYRLEGWVSIPLSSEIFLRLHNGQAGFETPPSLLSNENWSLFP